VPELPEVEVTRRRIEPLLVGRTISAVHATANSYFFLTPPRRLRRRLVGLRVSGLSRHGKYLLAELGDDSRLLLHLGMTGQLFSGAAVSVRLLSATARAALGPEEQPSFEPDVHTHLRLCFEDRGPDVFFRDVRKFGKVLLLEPGASDPRLDKLGPDALQADGEHLFAASRGRKLAVKGLLLSQEVLAGVGNIYADEALFAAGVRPRRRASRVTRREYALLAREIRRILLRSIETGGSSISDYISPDGSDGAYQDERQVYAREGDACYSCGTEIRKTTVAQRGTHYCPRCQR
jgi:formamidopyrimidine-DNA glycosylase